MSKFLTILFSVVLLALGATQARATNVAEFYANDAAIETLFEQAEVVEFTQVENQIAAVTASFASQGSTMETLSPSGDNQIVAILLCWLFGGIAIHRVYLGSTPLMILYYIITACGIFGIVPLIDFVMLIVKGVDSYLDSNKYFSFS